MGYEMSLILLLASLTCSLVSGKPFPQDQDMASFKMNNGQTFKCVDFYNQPAFDNSSLNLQLAVVQTKGNPNKKFFGANGFLTIYKPHVLDYQWSSARIKLKNGADSIEAGWMVNPGVFKDREAHLYASFSVGERRCINMDCPGFVQVSTDIPLGIVPNKYSVLKGEQIGWNISIDKHQDDGNWWLSITSSKHQIGYWPKTLFTTLGDVANQVEFGGEVNNPGGDTPFPSMGNGYLPDYNTEMSASFMHATVVDESFNSINPPETEKVFDFYPYYLVFDGGYQGESLGRLIFYGGVTLYD